jgi:outer membrane lipoprotein SlyB
LVQSRLSRRVTHEVEVGVSGALAGAAVGAVAGPPGAIAGAIVGGVVGALAGAVLEDDAVGAAEHQADIDALGTPDGIAAGKRLAPLPSVP